MKRSFTAGLVLLIFMISACKKDPETSHDQSSNYLVTTYSSGLSVPFDIDFDLSGNLLIADNYDHQVKKIDLQKNVSNLAGSTAGYLDGPANLAQFDGLISIVADKSGIIYVADLNNFRIRKISAGVVTTFIGNGVEGFTNDTGTNASVGKIYSMVTDQSGNLFFTQEGFYGIRKVTGDGVVSTFAGTENPGYLDGQGTSAMFSWRGELAIDAADNIYFSDGNKIRKISPGGMVSTYYKQTYYFGVISMDPKTGNLYFCEGDLIYNKISMLTTEGSVIIIANAKAGFNDGPGNIAGLGIISDITVGKDGAVYVSEFAGTIRKIQKN